MIQRDVGRSFSLGILLVMSACASGSGLRSELAVPDVRQATAHTCGPAALQAVLAYYGIELREDELATELGATPRDGVTPQALARGAETHGLRARFSTDTTLEALRAAISTRNPVIVAIQAWAEPAERPRYAELWAHGHYVVLIDLRDGKVVVEDPSLLGSRGVLATEEFLERWHDEDLGVRSRRGAIFFSGRPPAPPPARVHVD